MTSRAYYFALSPEICILTVTVTLCSSDIPFDSVPSRVQRKKPVNFFGPLTTEIYRLAVDPSISVSISTHFPWISMDISVDISISTDA